MTHQRPVFVSARFRSGSTMLWHLLRQLDGVTAFYEPCHDNLCAHVRSATPVQDSHRGVTSYWDEYAPLMDRLPALHANAFGASRLHLEADDAWPAFERYLRFLIASTRPRRAALQMNRVDLRLPWLRARFPEALVVHLVRNPRDQWLSMVAGEPDATLGDPDENTAYDLLLWAVSLAGDFPFLVGPHIRHSYERHYLIWRLSAWMGARCSHVSLSYDDLVADPCTGLTILVDALGVSRNWLPRLAAGVTPGRAAARAAAPSPAAFTRMEAGCDALLERLGCAEGLGRVPLAEIRASHGAAWAPYIDGAPREAARLAATMFSRFRSHYLDTVHAMRQLAVNARNVEAALARRERELRALRGRAGAA
ncbi:MAG: sulfotransferase [Vicinamibacterales bacterium]